MSIDQLPRTASEPREQEVRVESVLEPIWSEWRIGWGIALALAIAFGLVSGWVIPRGPITSTEAIISIGAAFLVGLAAGSLTGNKWSILAVAAVFALAVELARLGVDGPTVDGVHLGSTYGVIAFIVGRGIHGFLVFLPLILGGVLGLWLANRLGHPVAAPIGAGGWIGVGVLAATVLVTGIQLARQATTAPILGSDGEPLPGSVAELTSVTIGDHEQALMIRGRSTDNPVLLYLAGGPGGTDIGAMRGDVGLEEEFIVVTWDQRGVGKSYSALDPTETLTVDQMVSDTIELTDYLRDRFDEDKIYLVGNSWGSALGVLAVQEQPGRYHALVGTGQMVSMSETDLMFWQDTLLWAEETGNTGLVDQLKANGPPPYENILAYEPAISHEHDWNGYPEFDSTNEMPAILFVPEYTWMERFNGFRSFLDTFAVLYPQLQDLDFREDARSLEVPVYMVLGEHEARGRAELADEWFDMLEAPSKERVLFDGAGHRAHFDQPARFAEFMAQVRTDTYTSTERSDL